MNPRELSADEQKILIKTLKSYFPKIIKEEPMSHESHILWKHAASLLAMILTDREIAKIIKVKYQLIQDPTITLKNLNNICEKFSNKGILQNEKVANPYYYRLPIIMGEYPRHTKKINAAIKEFNLLIEQHHQKLKNDSNAELNAEQLNQSFLKIVSTVAQNGSYCFTESLTELVNMMYGYSCIEMNFNLDQIKEEKTITSSTMNSEKKASLSDDTSEKSIPTKAKNNDKNNKKVTIPPIRIIAAKSKNLIGSSKPFSEQSVYAINRAGRLASQSSKLVVNGFGLKFGGHFDGLLTHTPNLIQVGDFYTMLWRELAQQIELPPEESDDAVKLRVLLLTTLKKLGMVVESTTDISDPSEYYISPFSTQPQAFLTPTSIKKILSEQARDHSYLITDDQLLTLSDHLSHTLFRMQFNISSALGIGANDDDTVSFSNDGRDYIFQFEQQESEWASKFAQISLHRQGPAQPHMNAAKGVPYELAAALITETEQMSQLQRSEYKNTIYNALIDNLVAELFPHPAFFENDKYKKYRKQYILTKNDLQQTQLSSYTEESITGIYKEDGQTTPMFRRAGTIDVHPLPKDHAGVSESLKSFNSRNPLAAKQFQYAEALQGGTRGHYVYNPIEPDSFIADIYNGQVIKNSDGSYIPFIGVIPKNFDKEFNQPPELCASFVVRMLHSSRLLTHCPTFRLNYNIIKSSFLPKKETIPDLPKTLSDSSFLQDEIQRLRENLGRKAEELSFQECEKAFASLFKNIVYLLRKTGLTDDSFLIFHHHLIKDPDFLKNMSRDNFDKIIRILKINAPIKDEILNKDYMSKIIYLEKLTQSFYPLPCIETAQQIERQAKMYTQPLTVHDDVQEYFKQLRHNPQVNLSRTQSPGMLFMKLRGDHDTKKRTLERKYADFDRMHTKNFISGHRDPEGSLVAKPSNVDEFMDWTTKGVGKLSVGLQHNSNPFGQVITSPFIGAYHAAKNTYAKTDSMIASVCATPLGMAGGAGESGFKLLSYGLKFIARPGVQANNSISYCTSQIDTSTIKGKAAITALFIPAVLHGLFIGIAESAVRLLYDCTISPIHDFVDQCKEKMQKSEIIPAINEHPLYLQSTPDNEPGFKIQISDKARDTLLEVDTKKVLIKQLKTLVDQIIATAHPAFTQQERGLITEQFITPSILTDVQWDEFYEPFNHYGELGNLLNKFKDKINSQLISSAYRCFLERLSDKRDDTIKQMTKLYKLLPEQIPALQAIVSFYEKHPNEQENYIILFSENGILRKNLKQRDNHVLTIHDAVMQAFDIETVKNALYEGNKNLFLTFSIKPIQDSIKKMPNHILEKLKQAKQITEQKQKIQNDIELAHKSVTELKNEIDELKVINNKESLEDIAEINIYIEKLNATIKKSQEQLLNLEFILTLAKIQEAPETKLNQSASSAQENDYILSMKDRAHHKWKLFATRELTHEFIPSPEIQAIFKIFLETSLSNKSDVINNSLLNLKKHSIALIQLCNIENIDAFYESYIKLKSTIDLSKVDESYCGSIKLLDDFVNVCMNTAVNKILDTINLKQQIENPLNKSKTIGNWLKSVYQSQDDFRSLLTEQLDQSFLHLAILRQAYIIHTLETSMKLKMNDERIHKTGLQKLLRVHYLENNAVKKNGTHHYEQRHIDDFETYLKAHGIEQSPTFHYADSRAKIKLGIFVDSHSSSKTLEAVSKIALKK